MKHLFTLIACLGLLLLAACTTAPSPQTTKPSVSHILTVELAPGDNEATLTERFGGQVIVMGDDFAILGFTSETSLSSEAWSSGEVEQNKKQFLASGYSVGINASRAWASGSRAWASGSRAWASASRAWASGEFELLPENTTTWKQIGLDQAYELAPKLGHGVKVAIIDTGIDLNHPALSEALAPANEWKDYVDGDNIPQEEGILGKGAYGHGTNVAGIIRQIAPSATILPIRILGPDGTGYMADLVQAIDWARQMGADIINLSLGSVDYSFSVDLSLTNAAKKGIMIVASTGNSGDEKVLFPAYRSIDPTKLSAPNNRLSVSSIDSNDQKSNFATFGFTVELVAPGENIYGPAPQLRMASWSGTSMAAPIASGALALALGETLKVSKHTLTDRLKDSSTDIYNKGNNQNFANKLGSGRIDIATFLRNILQ